MHAVEASSGNTHFVDFHNTIGDAPVLCDGSQNGTAGTATSLADDETALNEAAAIFETAYNFAADNVDNW